MTVIFDPINVGVTPNDDKGDNTRASWMKQNRMTSDLIADVAAVRGAAANKLDINGSGALLTGVAKPADVAGKLDKTGDASGTSVTPSDGRGAAAQSVLIGQTSIRFYPENYGVGVGTGGNDYAAINAAISAAATVNGTAVLRNKSYRTAQGLKVPSNVTLRFEGAQLYGTANTNVINLAQNATLDGYGDIYVGGSSAFSSAVIEANGSDVVTGQQIGGAINLHNISGSRTGDGLRIISSTAFANRVVYARVDLALIEHFAIGIHVTASGSAFSNSNTVRFGVVSECLVGIQTDVDTASAGAGSNYFMGAVQPDAQSTRAVIFGGQGNVFDGMIWDWNISASPTVAVEFSSGAKNNRVRSSISPDLVLDRATAFRNEANLVEDWSSFAPSARSTMPYSMRWQTFAGNQDDILAFADKRYTVTQTAGSAPTAGSLAGVFDLDVSNNATWTTASTYPVSVEVDFGASPPTYLFGLGASFDFGGIPSNVILETYDGATWTARRTFTNNGRTQVAWQAGNFVVNVKKVRVTFSGPPSSGSIYLGRFFGFGTTSDGGGAYRPTFSDRPLVFRDGGQPVPAPIPGYVQIYRDPSTFKFMLMEGNGTTHALAFQ